MENKRSKELAPGVSYAFTSFPEPGSMMEMKPGLFWVRMPLPFALDHINLWLMEEDDGWILVDCGFYSEASIKLWENIYGTQFKGKPLKKLLITHFHPDHSGLSGWHSQKWGLTPYMPKVESETLLNMLSEDYLLTLMKEYDIFYSATGCPAPIMDALIQRSRMFIDNMKIKPKQFELIEKGADNFEIIYGYGHSPQHASLYDAKAKILISGDMVLPKISTNVSTTPFTKNTNPLKDYFDSIKAIREKVPDDVLVLPSHNAPFHGLHARIDYLIAHHDERFAKVLSLAAEPVTAWDVCTKLFHREINAENAFFAIGETIAHFTYLAVENKIEIVEKDGLKLYRAV